MHSWWIIYRWIIYAMQVRLDCLRVCACLQWEMERKEDRVTTLEKVLHESHTPHSIYNRVLGVAYKAKFRWRSAPTQQAFLLFSRISSLNWQMMRVWWVYHFISKESCNIIDANQQTIRLYRGFLGLAWNPPYTLLRITCLIWHQTFKAGIFRALVRHPLCRHADSNPLLVYSLPLQFCHTICLPNSTHSANIFFHFFISMALISLTR